MPQRSLSFGTAAADYERFRPGYPDALVDLVLAYAGRPLAAALEIGAGTGKATRAFAARGVAVTATEPDPAMLAELRRHVPETVVAMQATFEQVATDRTFDLVFAAASLHWTRPEGRWTRVLALLAPGGVFAAFGGPQRLADPDLAATVAEARRELLPDDDVPPPDGTPSADARHWPGGELVTVPGLADVRQVTIARRLVLAADDVVGQLGTVSAYLELPPPDRAEVLRRIRAVLPATVDVDADLTVHLARRG